ncbi:hypothetical protein PMAYCL1PPCAC_20061, partial [Pristionchus mayeri]
VFSLSALLNGPPEGEMAAKRPRIESGPKEPPRAQFFAPYPEEDDEEEDNDHKELAGSNEAPSDSSHMTLKQSLNQVVASLNDKQGESSSAVIRRSGNGEITEEQIQRHKCIVCNRLCGLTELLPFTSDQHKRTRWVNSVRWTPEGRRSLIALLSVTECPFLCASHFLPSDFNHDSSHIDLRPDAVPFFVEAPHLGRNIWCEMSCKNLVPRRKFTDHDHIVEVDSGYLKVKHISRKDER